MIFEVCYQLAGKGLAPEEERGVVDAEVGKALVRRLSRCGRWPGPAQAVCQFLQPALPLRPLDEIEGLVGVRFFGRNQQVVVLVQAGVDHAPQLVAAVAVDNRLMHFLQ